MSATPEKSACGVGFVANRKSQASHDIIQQTLLALRCEEHRGACSADQLTGDGSGIMTDIPFDLLGYQPRTIAVATLFAPSDPESRRQVLDTFHETFTFLGMNIRAYRPVPIREEVLGQTAYDRLPYIVQAIIDRPDYCSTDSSFDKLLYTAKQFTQTHLKRKGQSELFFASLSATTIVYKALTRSEDLDRFYLDLQNPRFVSRFGLFHRRFSTNTSSAWDRVQPFRIIGHNGEFNTIRGNRSWAVARERSMGLYDGELLTHKGISDSGSMNEMVEALSYRSSIPYIDEVLAIMMPPAHTDNAYYQFWERAMEPWDGPALITYSDGLNIGARLDRNGFRPCRWAMTDEHFYLSSEAGSFHLDESSVLSKGALKAGSSVRVSLKSGNVFFVDPSKSRYNYDAKFDVRTYKLPFCKSQQNQAEHLDKQYLFSYTQEDLSKVLIPMIQNGKESIGSMGDTARLAIFSQEPRSFYDYFYHNFAQVTNPPLDFLREKLVTNLRTYLGRKPNIFAKKELMPAPVAYELPSPVISLGQMEAILNMDEDDTPQPRRIISKTFSTCFPRDFGLVGFEDSLNKLVEEVLEAIRSGISIIVLSDAAASYDHPPMPSLLALGRITSALRESGSRLKFSIVVHSGEIRTTHQLATAVGMGAAAVCPYLALEIARYQLDKKLDSLDADQKEKNLIKAYELGLLKIMSKMGISVVRSYQSSRLFTSVGLDAQLVEEYFMGVSAKLHGIGLSDIIQSELRKIDIAQMSHEVGKLPNIYQFKEHARGKMGEKHSMTANRSKIIHKLVREEGKEMSQWNLYQEYLEAGSSEEPVAIRHIFALKAGETPLELAKVEPRQNILKRFGSGAMSFGAISAESQRDIFKAMKQIGGRSNSGEGGENPYYYEEGITAYSKQVASGRFGVNALYLISGEEIQIKVAQGAKPGEGGQLMGVKVDEHIAKARNSFKNVDLISPPPLHDIYSIEDLRQLIYELKQLKPGVPVNVKLVAGAGIGTIACGVAKAGADVIHISGGEGGTGAATLSSMKHAGLPWELGLWEVHQALLDQDLRQFVKLRVDGGIHSGHEILVGALLGAEEFDFGKLLLIAEGCIMARVCEKNTCPTGIATHAPRFKAKYHGEPEHIVKMLEYLAEDVRHQLAQMGYSKLDELVGRADLLEASPKHMDLIRAKKLNLNSLTHGIKEIHLPKERMNPFSEPINFLNEKIVEDSRSAIQNQVSIDLKYAIEATDRAIPATLSGELARLKHYHFSQQHNASDPHYTNLNTPYRDVIHLEFSGSAGQSFGAYLQEGIHLKLFGEANDSVAKTMSGGKVIILPHPQAKFKADENVIIGNVALYGATGGVLYVNGSAADRFAVRNSGALAVVEGVGMHACEYMTRGKVVILGETSYNIGGGMTGGEVILFGNHDARINHEYIAEEPMSKEELDELKELMADYYEATQSQRASYLLENWDSMVKRFCRYKPLAMVGQAQKEELAPMEA